MAYHALLSPSSAKRWSSCSASVKAQAGLTDGGSEAARIGTCGHQLSAECLEHGHDPQSYLGRKMLFWKDEGAETGGEDWADALTMEQMLCVTHEVVVDQEQIDACAVYINFVNELVATTASTLYVEQRVPIGHITGEEDAGGTSDAILVSPTVLATVDLKLGRGKVTAYDIITPAHEDIVTGELVPEVVRCNLQLALYLLGSLKKYPGDYTHVKAVIVQPHLSHVSEYACTVKELLTLGKWLEARAEETRSNPQYAPSGENCHFCKASGNCEAQTKAVLETALVGFDDVDQAQPRPISANLLGSLYAVIPLVQQWCKDVETRVYEELQAGHPVMRNDGLRYKLVTGKKGAREWDNPTEAEALMKKMRLKQEQMYTQKLISPAVAEKLAKAPKVKKGEAPVEPVIGQRQWGRLEALISQKDGAPAVALETDPRPAIASAVDGFEDVAPDVADNCADLF